MLITPLTTKAHDRRASGDCGTSGCLSKIIEIYAVVVRNLTKDIGYAAELKRCKICHLGQNGRILNTNTQKIFVKHYAPGGNKFRKKIRGHKVIDLYVF